MGLVGCSSGVCGLSLGCRWGVGLVFGGCFGDRWVGEIEGGSFPGIGLGGGLIPRFPCFAGLWAAASGSGWHRIGVWGACCGCSVGVPSFRRPVPSFCVPCLGIAETFSKTVFPLAAREMLLIQCP